MPRITVGLEVRRLPGVYIRGTGAYFPARTVGNDEILDLMIEHTFVRDDRRGWRAARNGLARVAGKGLRAHLRRKHPDSASLVRSFGIAPAVVEKLGVERRQWAHFVGDRLDPKGEHSSDMALAAARMALEDAGIAPWDVDALIVTTTTPPRLNSSSALWVGEQLGVRCPAYDLRAGCAGGLYALLNAAMYLQHGCRNVLVVGAEAYSRFVPPTSRDAIFVAGDGAGAVVLSRCEDERGVLGGLVGADPSYDARFHTLGQMPPTPEAAAAGHYIVQGNPRDMVEASFKTYLEILPRVLALAEVRIEEIGYHVPHQTSLGVIKAVARHLGHPLEKTFVNIHEHGNIGAACLLAGLHEARQAGHLKPGEKLLAGVVGGTMTWGALVLQQ
jgi:3-oxoacyl-[acyl-carrier-protein] synthase-3